MSDGERRVVITGLGVVAPIGIGKDAFWKALVERRSGIRQIPEFQEQGFPSTFGGRVRGFDPLAYVKQRKSLKVMARDIQLAVAGAKLAAADAGLAEAKLDPTRVGVEFGAGLICTDLDELALPVTASVNGCRWFDIRKWGEEGMGQLFPLWLLKYLPNMLACHVSIFHEARGPNNTITESEAASNLAIGEAYRIICRGHADVIIAGGADNKIHPLGMVRLGLLNQLSRRNDSPQTASRPFDAQRDGMVPGEGAGVLILEELEHARRRGAKMYAEVVGFGAGCDGRSQGRVNRQGIGPALAMENALRDAGMNADEVGHINAHGLSGPLEDEAEARAIYRVFGPEARRVPVTANKSYFGNLGAGTGAVELIASVLALEQGVIPPTLNYEQGDPECRLNVVAGDPMESQAKSFVSTSFTTAGQSAALAVRAFAA